MIEEERDYGKFTYVLIEDSATIATLTKKHFKKLGIDLILVVQPNEVYNLEAVLREHYNKSLKDIVCICDENFFSLDDNFTVIPEKGTNLRRRLLAERPAIRSLFDNKHLLFLACSASVVCDANVQGVVGKSLPPKKQVNIIWNIASDYFASSASSEEEHNQNDADK